MAAALVQIPPAAHHVADVDHVPAGARLLVRHPREPLPVDEALEAEGAVAVAAVGSDRRMAAGQLVHAGVWCARLRHRGWWMLFSQPSANHNLRLH